MVQLLVSLHLGADWDPLFGALEDLGTPSTKKIEIILSIFSDHSGMKLEVNCKKPIV